MVAACRKRNDTWRASPPLADDALWRSRTRGTLVVRCPCCTPEAKPRQGRAGDYQGHQAGTGPEQARRRCAARHAGPAAEAPRFALRRGPCERAPPLHAHTIEARRTRRAVHARTPDATPPAASEARKARPVFSGLIGLDWRARSSSRPTRLRERMPGGPRSRSGRGTQFGSYRMRLRGRRPTPTVRGNSGVSSWATALTAVQSDLPVPVRKTSRTPVGPTGRFCP